MEIQIPPNDYPKTKTEAIILARSLLTSNSIIIIDTELNDLPNSPCVEIIELATINLKGKNIYHSIFSPMRPLSDTVMEIIGTSNDDLKNAPKFVEKYSCIKSLLDGKIVTSYSNDFDKTVLLSTCALYSLPSPNCKWFCARSLHRAFSESSQNRLQLPLNSSTETTVDYCKATLDLLKTIAHG